MLVRSRFDAPAAPPRSDALVVLPGPFLNNRPEESLPPKARPPRLNLPELPLRNSLRTTLSSLTLPLPPPCPELIGSDGVFDNGRSSDSDSRDSDTPDAYVC